jgi:hypothetical protein
MVPPDEVPDRYVRIAKAELPKVHLEHLASAVDLSIAIPHGLAPRTNDVLTGYTEWAGKWNRHDVSVGWDWAVLAGVIVVLTPATIRTNVQVIMDDGMPAPPMLTRILLFEWLETLPWREPAITELLP